MFSRESEANAGGEARLGDERGVWPGGGDVGGVVG